MSIQRYRITGHDDPWMEPDEKGEVVDYADHVAALHQAVADVTAFAVKQIMGEEEDTRRDLMAAYEHGQRDALASQTSESRPRLPANGIPATSVAPAGEDYGALMYAEGQRDALAIVEAARDAMPDTTIRRELDRVIRAIKGDSDV